MNNDKRYIFICGMHRSGTSVVHRILRDHPDISGFQNTGAQQDEGQFLQTVYPNVNMVGGAGMFGFSKKARLTEKSSLITNDNKRLLHKQWYEYWDINKSYLVEKTPQNLIMMRFLQKIFNNAYFIIIIRHPMATSMATSKWSQTSYASLLEHWVKCHSIMIEDLQYIKRYKVIYYENFVNDPDEIINKLSSFLDLENITLKQHIMKNINSKYEKRWKIAEEKLIFWENGQIGINNTFPLKYRLYRALLRKIDKLIISRLSNNDASIHCLHKEMKFIICNFEDKINEFGYTFDDFNHYKERIS